MLTLHIGLPKTGTTYLQKVILPKAAGLTLIHRDRGRRETAICMDLRRYVRAAAPLAALLRLRLRPRLVGEVARAAAEGRALLVSAENISVHAIDFWHDTDPPPEHVAARLAALAAGPGASLAPVRVVIGLRQQDQWLASRYAESGKDLPNLSQADFDRRLGAIAEAPELAGALAWLDYGRIHRSFADALGGENVHHYWMEELAANPAPTLRELGRFVGGDRLATALARIGRRHGARRRNSLSRGENVWNLRGGDAELRLEPALQQALQARFRGPNDALVAMLTRR